MDPPPSKRRRLSSDPPNAAGKALTYPRTLSHPVSPPLTKRHRSIALSNEQSKGTESPAPANASSSSQPHHEPSNRIFSSPFQLTWIQDLPDAANTDAVTLRDLLGDPLIAECWEFNYLHDIDFLMAAFDEDVRDLVQVHLIHGFWKNEDSSRLMLQVSLS